MDCQLTHSNSRRGSSFVEAAMVFPLIIAIVAVSITVSLKLYTVLKENSIEHKEKMLTQYETYEKGRLLISIHCDDTFIINGLTCCCNYGKLGQGC